MNCDVRKMVLGSPTRINTNRPVKSQKKARILKFLLHVEEESYHSVGEIEALISFAVTAKLICIL